MCTDLWSAAADVSRQNCGHLPEVAHRQKGSEGPVAGQLRQRVRKALDSLASFLSFASQPLPILRRNASRKEDRFLLHGEKLAKGTRSSRCAVDRGPRLPASLCTPSVLTCGPSAPTQSRRCVWGAICSASSVETAAIVMSPATFVSWMHKMHSVHACCRPGEILAVFF